MTASAPTPREADPIIAMVAEPEPLAARMMPPGVSRTSPLTAEHLAGLAHRHNARDAIDSLRRYGGRMANGHLVHEDIIDLLLDDRNADKVTQEVNLGLSYFQQLQQALARAGMRDNKFTVVK